MTALAEPIQRQRALVTSGATTGLAWRRQQLRRLDQLLRSGEQRLLAALAQDLRKPSLEAYFEIVGVRQELTTARRQVRQWMRSTAVSVPISVRPARAFVRPEPLGCVLIIAPWNYPVLLALQPLVAALAAGNTAMLKPSEQAPASAETLATLVAEHFPAEVVQVRCGGVETAQALLAERFDHIFFTGGTAIGRQVMAAAARHLTPVTLELGGKSPCIVCRDADVALAARRIAWGKGLNAGQSCIAPDYILVDPVIRDALITALQRNFLAFYGDDPQQSADYGRLINQRQFDRLDALLTGRELISGGRRDGDDLYIEPTLVTVERDDDPLMAEELFGPVLPLLSMEDLDQALSSIRAAGKPLALYLFSSSAANREKVLRCTSSGGVCFNDVFLQASLPHLPFGGVGESGIGAYHGRSGFDTFSHRRAVLSRPQFLDSSWRYPPYGNRLGWIRRLLG